MGGNLEEVSSVRKASALLAHHLASSIFTGRNRVLSPHLQRAEAVPELPEGQSKAVSCRTFVSGWGRTAI